MEPSGSHMIRNVRLVTVSLCWDDGSKGWMRNLCTQHSHFTAGRDLTDTMIARSQSPSRPQPINRYWMQRKQGEKMRRRGGIQRAALFVVENYSKDFPVYTPNGRNLGKVPVPSEGKSEDGLGHSTASQSQLSSANYKDRYYEDIEYERKIRRRRARLVVTVHRAFSQVNLMDDGMKSSQALPPREAAQSIFPLIAQSLQRYLRTTRQAHLYTMEAIIQHLNQCLTHNMSAQAFLEQYLRPGPPCQYSGAHVDQWTLLSEESVTGSLRSALTFCLRGADTQLVVSVSRIPRLTLSESFVPSISHRFVVRLYPPLLDTSTISPA